MTHFMILVQFLDTVYLTKSYPEFNGKYIVGIKGRGRAPGGMTFQNRLYGMEDWILWMIVQC